MNRSAEAMEPIQAGDSILYKITIKSGKAHAFTRGMKALVNIDLRITNIII